MRILVLGGSGMLGHKVVQLLRSDDVWVTLRDERSFAEVGLFDHVRVIDHIDGASESDIGKSFDESQPDVVINCIGIVKQHADASRRLPSIEINALLPHRVAKFASSQGVRLIHVSTDCVFSGRRGMYREDEPADADDLYGRTKWLGEVLVPAALTIRTSIIGRELRGSFGLVEWFLANRGGEVRGYRNAIFSGVTTLVLARLIIDLCRRPDVNGLYHVAADPIRKYDLLHLLNDAYEAGVKIVPDDQVRIDRSLDGTRFRKATGWSAPDWPAMITEMASDVTSYDQWRSHVL